MKKRTVGLLLSVTLSLCLFGCGNEEPKQEEVQEVVQEDVEVDAGTEQKKPKQEEAQEEESDIVFEDTGDKLDFVLNDMKVEVVEGEVTTPKKVSIYNSEGKKLGYIKEGVTLSIVGHCENSLWYLIENPESQTDDKYLYIDDYNFDNACANTVKVIEGAELEGYDFVEVEKEIYENEDNIDISDSVDTSDPMFAYSIFSNVIRGGGYGTDWQLAEEGDGLMVNVPNENTKEWSEEKLKLIKEKGVTSLNFEGYGWTDDGSNVMIWLKTDNGLLTVEELQKIFQDGQSDETSPQDEILAKAGYDKDKTYTAEEYIEILTKIFEEMGKEYNKDVEKDFINKTTLDGYHCMMAYYDIDFSDSEDILQNTKNAMSYIEGGLDGMSDIVEFSIGKGTSNGKETINVYVKVKN